MPSRNTIRPTAQQLEPVVRWQGVNVHEVLFLKIVSYLNRRSFLPRYRNGYLYSLCDVR